MSIRHGGPRPRWYAVSSTTLNTGSGRWFITVTDHQQDWLCRSLLMTRTALHAHCAIVIPSATMRVQNYTGSGIKRDSC